MSEEVKDYSTCISADLSPQQWRFVEEYLIDPSNQGKAAIRAGYSMNGAKQAASRIMSNPNVRAAIEQGQKERAHRMGITQDRVLQELALIAFSNLQDIVDVNEDGETTTNINKLSRGVAAALGEVSITKKGGRNRVTTSKVKLHDKMAALDKIARHLGMFVEKIEHSGVMTLEQLVNESLNEKVLD